MRNMSVPQRSQVTFSSPVGHEGFGPSAVRMGVGMKESLPGSGLRRIIGHGKTRNTRKTDHTESMTNDGAAREAMVATQIERRGVRDRRVLEAMRSVLRHRFVDAHLEPFAYDDRPLPIGEGQTISQPYMVAVMTEALGVGADDRVLEIGTGSGYQTAVLAQLAREVISIERHAPLADRARGLLEDLAVDNVTVIVGDGSEGWPAGAPYDRILVTAGAPNVPETLRTQLAPGGRLVIPVGPSGLQHVTIIDRTPDGFRERLGDACVFVPLVGKHAW